MTRLSATDEGPLGGEPTVRMLGSEWLERKGSVLEAFLGARFFPHVVIDGFFDQAVCQGLLDEFPEYQEKDALNELGKVGLKAVCQTVRDLGSTYRQVDDLVQSAEFLTLISEITGIADLRYDPDYVGGGTHNNLHGTELDPHVDFNYHPKTSQHRRLNLIVFLTTEWEEDWGGCFAVHKNPRDPEEDEHEAVVPALNRAVIIETNERSWHGFNKVNLPEDKRELSRKSFALYFYTDERPAAEAAPSHATVYVPRPLPDNIVSGTVLSEDDVMALKVATARRDLRIEYLYEREKVYSDALDQLRRRVIQLQDALRQLPLEGPLTQGSRSEGVWEDLWIAKVASIHLTVEDSISSLAIEGWGPELSGQRGATIDVADKTFEREVEPGPFCWDLDVDCDPGSELTVDILCESTYQPTSDGASSDNRELGFLLRSIRGR